MRLGNADRHSSVLLLPVFLWTLLTWHGAQAAVKDDYYNLYDYLFSGNFYKKDIRPAEGQDDPLVVGMNFFLLSIVDVNEKQQMLQTSARLEMSWDDDFLEWNNTEYGGITDLLVPQKIVYVPDIVLGNSVSAQTQIGYELLPIRLTYEGLIMWEPTLLLSTDCNIDITYFPFDTQLCRIEFETAVSKFNEIDIDVYKDTSNVLLEDFQRNGQWDLVETSAENLSNEDSKTKIRFSLVIKRRRTFYILNIILPVFFLSLTASLVFALPADEGEKMGTGITVLLAFAVYLTIVSEIVPNTSLQVSILALYLTILLGLCALSVVICVFVLRLHHRDADRPVGPATTRIILFFRYTLCLDSAKPSSGNQVSPGSTRADMRDMKDVNVNMQMPRLSMRDKWGRASGTPTGMMQHSPHPHNHHHHPDSGRPMSGMSSRKHRPDSRPSGGQYSPEPEETELPPMTWQVVARTLDWVFFIVFTASTFLVTLILLLYLHFGSIADAPSL